MIFMNITIWSNGTQIIIFCKTGLVDILDDVVIDASIEKLDIFSSLNDSWDKPDSFDSAFLL